MPKFIDEEEKKEPIRQGELLRQAGVVVCLVLGALLQKAGIGIGAAAAFIAAAVCAVSWILFVRKEKK
ncbi:MAG: hypothetical protein Q4C06_06085 [Bacillota bacterium]|nr:hypothetical protein [Bacillota bacterium]